jgi:hypothetical protein
MVRKYKNWNVSEKYIPQLIDHPETVAKNPPKPSSIDLPLHMVTPGAVFAINFNQS